MRVRLNVRRHAVSWMRDLNASGAFIGTAR
jgi:hypothetical protein